MNNFKGFSQKAKLQILVEGLMVVDFSIAEITLELATYAYGGQPTV